MQGWWSLVHVTIICLSLVELGSPCRPRGSSQPAWLCSPSVPYRLQNLCRARPGPTLCWEILQALGITACFQHLYLKPSSVACPWVCLFLWLLSVCCKGAGLLHQLLLPKCWPWGPRLFFCLTIFTCFLGP